MPRLLMIPERYERGLVQIKRLQDSDVQHLLRALGDATATNTQREIATLLEPALPLLTAADIKALVDALYSLYVARAKTEITAVRFVSELLNAIRQSTNKDIATSDPEEVSRLTKTLTDLLSVPALSTKAKAYALRTDFANTFCDSKIITDLRPVFDTDVKDEPAGAVITHTLKLEYHHCGKHTEIHIALEKPDIENLLTTLKRAQDKAVTLSSVTAKHGLRILGE
jgi:hypothetical protein